MKSRDFKPTRTWRRKNWVALLAGQERPALDRRQQPVPRCPDSSGH